ncbi:MAG: hypothetical protein ACI9LG_002472, partial [Moritella dasanensis]
VVPSDQGCPSVEQFDCYAFYLEIKKGAKSALFKLSCSY